MIFYITYHVWKTRHLINEVTETSFFLFCFKTLTAYQITTSFNFWTRKQTISLMFLSLSSWSWDQWGFPATLLSCFWTALLLSGAQLAFSSRHQNQDLLFQAFLLSTWEHTPKSQWHPRLCIFAIMGFRYQELTEITR